MEFIFNAFVDPEPLQRSEDRCDKRRFRSFNLSRLTGGRGNNYPHLRLTCITFLSCAVEQIFFVTFPKYVCFTECTYFLLFRQYCILVKILTIMQHFYLQNY